MEKSGDVTEAGRTDGRMDGQRKDRATQLLICEKLSLANRVFSFSLTAEYEMVKFTNFMMLVNCTVNIQISKNVVL